MKVLLATTPASGHVNPLLPVARELVRRGHEVLWYTGRAFRAKLEALGATHHPMRLGHDYSDMTDRDETFPELAGKTGLAAFSGSFKRVFFDPAPGQCEDLLAALERFPAEVVVADETCFGAGLACEKAGLPLVTVATSVYFFRSRDAAPVGLALPPDGSPLGRVRNGLLGWLADHVLLRDLRGYADAVRARVGLPRLERAVLENLSAPPALYLLGTVGSFEYPRRDLLPNTHFVGPLLDAPAGTFTPPPWWDELKGPRPVVHVTQGTVTTNARELLAPALRALGGEDVLVVATGARDAAALGLARLPPNARLEPFLPHAHLLPHVDVMVTNGGYQGVNTALAHGVPLVVAGTTEEKPEVAAHVAWSGAGVDLKTRRPTEAQLRRVVRRVLGDPRIRANAERLRREAQGYGGAVRAAELIEGLLDGAVPGGLAGFGPTEGAAWPEHP